MTQLQANLTAIMNGDSGAPPLQADGLGAIAYQTVTILAGAIDFVPKGIHLFEFSGGANTSLEFLLNGSWSGLATSARNGFLWSDGVNVRINNIGTGTVTLKLNTLGA